MTNNEDFKRCDPVEYITVDDAISYMEIAVPMHVLTDRSHRRFNMAKYMAIEALKSLNKPLWTCGYCGMHNDRQTPFCPYCGKPMDIEE